MIGFARFDPETFRRQLTKYTDLELIKMGRACAPAEWLIADPLTKAEKRCEVQIVSGGVATSASEGRKTRGIKEERMTEAIAR